MNWPKATSGQRLSIPADLHNATIDAVEAYLRSRNRSGGTARAAAPHQAEILVSNDTGDDLVAGSVVGLDAPIAASPSSGLDAFLFSEMIVSGVTPAASHAGGFAVLVEPIADGHVGRACAQGLARVKVQIDDTDVADWAEIDAGETGNLLAAVRGSARILWRNGSGTGTVWCVCELTGGSVDNRVSVTASDATSDTLRSNDSDPHKIVGDNEAQITESCGITAVAIATTGTVTVDNVGNITTGSQVAISGIIGSVGAILNGNTYYVAVAGAVLTLYTDEDRTVTVDTSAAAYTSGGTVSHSQDVAAGSGWIDFQVLEAADGAQQLVGRHAHTGETVETTLLVGPCGISNFRFDAGHVIAFETTDASYNPIWIDAFTGEEL